MGQSAKADILGLPEQDSLGIDERKVRTMEWELKETLEQNGAIINRYRCGRLEVSICHSPRYKDLSVTPAYFYKGSNMRYLGQWVAPDEKTALELAEQIFAEKTHRVSVYRNGQWTELQIPLVKFGKRP